MHKFDEMVEAQMRTGLGERFALQAAMQEVVLSGLSDGGFFRHAAFYGGTCLRFFHGLDRFSEDLEFIVLDQSFGLRLTAYFDSVSRAFQAVGREVEVREIGKSVFTDTESAFVKTETKAYQIGVRNAPKTLVKVEMDTNPSIVYPSEAKFLMAPDPHPIVCCTREGLLVGKSSACLFRAWKNRIKGRDWFDLAWYAGLRIPLRLDLLRQVTVAKHPQEAERMTNAEGLRTLFYERIDTIDFDSARNDVAPFVMNPARLDCWSRELFRAVVDSLVVV